MIEYPNSHHCSQVNLPEQYPELYGDQHFDVCVIGGGYTGLSSALRLAESGYRVAVLEACRVGWGASGRNGGQLGYSMTDLLPELQRKFGNERARKFWELSVEAVELFHRLCEQYNISCDFQSGVVGCAVTKEDFEGLAEHVAIVESYGNDAGTLNPTIYECLDQAATSELSGSQIYRGGILSHRSGHLNPMKYLLGLARAAVDAGAVLFEASRVERIEYNEPPTVRTAKGRVTADKLVIACNGYLQGLNHRLANRILPVDNYQVATEPLAEPIRKLLIQQKVCIWDTSRSVHYFRMTADHRLVMGCGIGLPGRPPRNLMEDCRRHIEFVYPQLRDVSLGYLWSGTLAGTLNGMPDVGKIGENAYYAQGFNGHGLAMAPLVGRAIADEILSESDSLPNSFPGSEHFKVLSSVQHRTIPGARHLYVPATLIYRWGTNTLDFCQQRLAGLLGRF